MRLFQFDCLLTDDLVCHNVFPAVEKGSEGCDEEGWDTDEDHINNEEDDILHHPKDGLIFSLVEYAIGSALHEEVEDVS